MKKPTKDQFYAGLKNSVIPILLGVIIFYMQQDHEANKEMRKSYEEVNIKMNDTKLDIVDVKGTYKFLNLKINSNCSRIDNNEKRITHLEQRRYERNHD